MIHRILALCLFFALLAGGAPLSAEERVRPDINAHYQDPEFERWRNTFERSGREVYDRRQAIVGALGLSPGMAVADVGAGTGFFSLLMAEAVGAEGKVYVVDIAENFVEGALARAQRQGLDNLVGVVNDQKSVRLPLDSVDLVFTSATYHHFEYPGATLTSIREALRPGGELVIIDFRKDQHASGWVQGHVRLGEQAVIAEVEAAGFEYLDEPLGLEEFFFFRFRRP